MLGFRDQCEVKQRLESVMWQGGLSALNGNWLQFVSRAGYTTPIVSFAMRKADNGRGRGRSWRRLLGLGEGSGHRWTWTSVFNVKALRMRMRRKDEVRCTCCGALLSRMSSGRIEPHLRRVHMSINLEELRQRFQV